MRIKLLASLGLALAGAAMLVPSPASAIEYPYCIQGGGFGVPGDCSYRTYAECRASASGRLVYCNVNPRFAYAGSRKMRTYRNY
jgi:hypothetical protein